MQRTKVLIYLAVWKRPEITELCFKGIERLKTHPDYDIQALAVISETEVIPLCEKYSIKWVFAENSPLGAKKNAGLLKAKTIQFDYLMEIGSDDLILNELLDQYKEHLGKDFFGVSDVAIINSEGGECHRVTGKSNWGAGRMISRAALITAKWKLWTDKFQSGLDGNSIMNLQKLGIKYERIKAGDFPCVIDVKSQENIWKFNYFLGIEYDTEKILSNLSVGEKEILVGMYATV